MDDMAYMKISAADGGAFNAYVAMPESGTGPAIILIQEIFGVNQELRDKCDALAKQGYIAICPDLFWRIEPGIELVDSDEAQLQRAFELFEQFDVEQGMEDLKSTLAFARDFGNGAAGCIGYCLGGKLAYMMACQTDIDASVSYYGVGIETMLDEAKQLKKPLLMHIAEEDEFVPPEAQRQIHEGIGNFKLIEIHTYPSMQHAFARGQGMHYNAGAAMIANKRTATFLEQNLGQAAAA